MARKKILSRFRKNVAGDLNSNSVGFGTLNQSFGDRLLMPNGRPNVTVVGPKLYDLNSVYYYFLQASTQHFFGIILLAILGVNLVFASLYFFVGIESIGGSADLSGINEWSECLFFSVQTFSGLGYGRLNPMTNLTGWISSLEAILGFLSIAIFTGLMFARFSRPVAYLSYSKNAIISRYQGGHGLMIRLVPNRYNYFIDAEAIVTLLLPTEIDGKVVNKFFNLNLEISKVSFLSLNWTIVHPIDDSSPLFGLLEQDYKEMAGEIMINFKAFDDIYSNQVVNRTSYKFEEVIFDVKFSPMYGRSADQLTTVLDLEKLSTFEKYE